MNDSGKFISVWRNLPIYDKMKQNMENAVIWRNLI